MIVDRVQVAFSESILVYFYTRTYEQCTIAASPSNTFARGYQIVPSENLCRNIIFEDFLIFRIKLHHRKPE